LEVATVGNDRQRVLATGVAGLLRHFRELGAVISDIGHLMRDDQVVLRIDCSLHVVAYNTSALAAGRHRARIWVGQRDLPVRLQRGPPPPSPGIAAFAPAARHSFPSGALTSPAPPRSPAGQPPPSPKDSARCWLRSARSGAAVCRGYSSCRGCSPL